MEQYIWVRAGNNAAGKKCHGNELVDSCTGNTGKRGKNVQDKKTATTGKFIEMMDDRIILVTIMLELDIGMESEDRLHHQQEGIEIKMRGSL